MSEQKKAELKYTSEIVDSIPTRKFRKGDKKYLPILNEYLEESVKNLTLIKKVEVSGKDANYARTQLKKVIDSDSLPINATVVNSVLYLERTDKPAQKVKKID